MSNRKLKLFGLDSPSKDEIKKDDFPLIVPCEEILIFDPSFVQLKYNQANEKNKYRLTSDISNKEVK